MLQQSILKSSFMMRGLCCVFLTLFITINAGVYDKYYQEALTIAEGMTLDQKIGQTIQLDFYAMSSVNGTMGSEAVKYNLGSILMGAIGCPNDDGNCIMFDGMTEDQVKDSYANATTDKWQKLANKFKYTVDVTTKDGKTYKIKPLLATDAVHGDQHVAGSILFPHNIGISCSHNENHFFNLGHWVQKSLKQYGFNYAFAPTVAASHNPQWGRFYETMGQDHDQIYKYAKSFTEGLQGKPNQLTGILGSVKHFFSDGATFYGADQGNAKVGSYKSFIHHNIQGYNSSIEAGIGSVMASYSAINFVPLASGTYLNSILKGDLNFDGFVISDYSEIEKLSAQYLPTSLETMRKNESVATMLAAGIDMFMIPVKSSMLDYIDAIKTGLERDTVSMERLNDAVARVISVKLGLGMIETQQKGNLKAQNQQIVYHQRTKETTEYEDSLNAVHESLVLLKNENVLPAKASELEYVVLVGQKILTINQVADYELFQNFDNIGMQNGGWTSRWQGFEGNSMWLGENRRMSNATSILDGLKNLKENIDFIYPKYSSFRNTTKIQFERERYLASLKVMRKNMNAKNTLIISVVGESPYAEMVGDIGIPYCHNKTFFNGHGCIWWPNTYSGTSQEKSLEVNFNNFDRSIISEIKGQDKNIPLVTVLLSGRPMIINDILEQSNAFVSAFLPGTSGGQGIVDALFGDYTFKPKGESDRTNTLSFDWPRSQDSLKEFPYYAADGEIPRIQDPLFVAGHGLSTARRN